MSWNTHIPKFRRFVLQNFPFIEQDFDALTDYELICKVVEYLNTVITSQNEVVAEVGRFETDVTNEINTFETNVNNEINTFETNITNDFNRLEGLFNELQSFVDNYFENLDVQEEINNKLDEMVESGTLQEIISQYINSTALWMFDNVADMKLATNFTNGSFARTLGFYNRNDKGGATYKIRTKTVDDSADEMTLIDLYDNTLIAELVKTNVMNVRQFGAKGDGVTDDTAVIQTALDYNNNIFVPTGTYMVDAETKINLNSYNVLKLDNDATIKAITNSARSYAVLWLEDVTNVEISGGTIEGDRLTHTGSDGEWGHCIRLLNACDEIYVHDINLINAWGDGLDVKITGSIVTERVHVDNARRNGYSIAAVGGFSSNDDFIENTNGTAPECGVDIEPDDATQIPFNVVFNNLRTKNNTRTGISVHLGKANAVLSNVRINNLRSDGDNRGFLADTTDLASGEVTVVDPLITNSVSSGIYLQIDGNGVNFQIIRPVVIGYGATSSSSSGIYLNNGTGDAGNIDIINPTVKSPIGETVTNRAINIASGSSGVWKHVRIIDPLDLDGRFINFNGANQNVMFTDKYECTAKDDNKNYNIGTQLFSLNTSSTYTANRTITIMDSVTFPDKSEISFINTGDYQMKVAFPNQYIYPLATVTGKTITLGDKGASMRIKKIGSNAWVVTSQTGAVTSN